MPLEPQALFGYLPKNANVMDQKIINLFDEYTHKPLKREEFLSRLAKLTGGTSSAIAVLPMLEVNYAKAQTVPPNDKRLKSEYVTYLAEGEGNMRLYVVRPAKKKKYGAVMVIHENRGLNPHIEDVTRRMALEGFLAFAPDALSPLGGTPTDADKARELFQKLDTQKNLKNFTNAFEVIKARKDCNGKLGVIGFCWGGGMANLMAVNVPDLKAACPFYGRQAELADVPKIKAALQLHYAGQDERINAGIPAYEEALKKSGIAYELHMYEGAQHAFHNDTLPSYHEQAAKAAWTESLAWLRAHGVG